MLILGHEFRFKGNDFKGPVIASADAFYFIITKHGLAEGAGLLGSCLVALNKRTGASAAETCYTKDLSELPSEILHDPAWRVRQESGTVLVLPHHAVRSVKIPWFWLYNRVYVSTQDLEIGTVYNLFRRRKIKGFLEMAGWKVEH